MSATLRLLLILALLLGAAMPQRGAAQEATPGAETAWRLLYYIAVDYPGAVSDARPNAVSDAGALDALLRVLERADRGHVRELWRPVLLLERGMRRGGW